MVTNIMLILPPYQNNDNDNDVDFAFIKKNNDVDFASVELV